MRVTKSTTLSRPHDRIWTGSYSGTSWEIGKAVAISLRLPKGWGKRPVLSALAPLPYMLKLPRLQYIGEYYSRILAKRSPEQIADLLRGRVMCCYEKPNVFCHRRIVAEWLKEKTGEEVLEWGFSGILLTSREMAEEFDRRPRQGVLFG